MITNNYSLTINGYECKLNKPLKFYQGDSLHLIFTVNQYEWVINNGNRVRAIMPINPLKAFLIIENAEDETTDTIESAFVENDEIHFHIDSKYTSFVGVGRMQLVLADDGCCSVTIPEFTYEIKKNITDKLLNLSKTTLIDTDNKVLMTDSGDDMITGLALSTESNTSKYIKDLPNKETIDGEESVLIQDQEGTKNVNMKVLLDDINSRTNLADIQNQLTETNAQLSTKANKSDIISNTSILKDISDIDGVLHYKGSRISPEVLNYEDVNLTNTFDNNRLNSSSNFSNIQATIIKCENGEVVFTANSTVGNLRILNVDFVQGHKYYFGAKVKASSSDVWLMCANSESNNYSMGINSNGTGEYELLRLVGEIAHNDDCIKVVDYRSGGFDNIHIKEIMVIDLTETFGVGKELGVIEFEKYMNSAGISKNFFNGNFTGKIQLSAQQTNTLFPIYVEKTNDDINVISKYSDTKDIRFLLNKKGVNNLFDFNTLFLIENNSNSTSNQLIGDVFLRNNTDFFAPYVVKAINNINGDKLDTDDFTGGNHGYNGDGTGATTARTTDVILKVDGRVVDDYSGYCHFIDIVWRNRVQATNTKLSSGNGREVLEETIELHYDGYEWRVRNTIHILEDVHMLYYYGLQIYFGTAWDGSIYYESCDNLQLNAANTYSNSNSKTCDVVRLKKNHDCVDMKIDSKNGLGRLNLLNEVDYNAMTYDYGKSYFYLINNANLNGGTVLTFSGSYRFYSS